MSDGMKQIVLGIVLIIIGLIVTGVTYSMASGGGSYVVTTGLFVVGVIRIIKGFAKMASGQ